MDRDEVRGVIRDELSEILDRDDVALTEATAAEDVPGWDSLTHLKLLVALESRCGVKFQLSEMAAPEDVGELVDLILAKRAAKA